MSCKFIKAEEFCDSVRDGTHDTPQPVQHGYKLITGKHIKNGQILPESAYFISSEDYTAINQRSNVEQWDVLMSMIGTVGEVAVVKDDPSYAIKNVALFKCGGSELKGRWLAYYLQNPTTKARMIGNMKGSSQQFLSLRQLRTLPIPIIETSVMKGIVDILSAYDDLIENNQKQIKLLEEAAQRLYKEWFVDLHFPSWENATIVDGVPEGWESTVIADVCQTIGGGTPSTKVPAYYDGGTIPWVTPTDITHSNSVALLNTEKKITDEGLKNSSAKMLPAETVLMTSRASVGYFGIYPYAVCTNQGFISCIPNNKNFQMYLLYNLMERVEEIRQKAGGSTYLEISKKTFRDMTIIVPSETVLNRFQQYAYDMFSAIRKKEMENVRLKEARDRLLPKLMSGELEV